MRVNVGTPDRVIRLIAGLVLAAVILFAGLGVFANPLLYWGGLVVAAILVVTAAVRFCPLYTVFGLSTCPTETRRP